MTLIRRSSIKIVVGPIHPCTVSFWCVGRLIEAITRPFARITARVGILGSMHHIVFISQMTADAARRMVRMSPDLIVFIHNIVDNLMFDGV